MLFFSTFKLHIFANTGWGRSRLTDVSLQNAGFILFLKKFLPKDIFSLFAKREEGRKGGRRERKRDGGGERQRERKILMSCRLIHAPTGIWTHNLSMCSDWESNPWHFCVQGDYLTTESHKPGLFLCYYLLIIALFSIQKSVNLLLFHLVYSLW